MYYIYAISDATGITAERVVRAALVQFPDQQIEIIRRGLIRRVEQINPIVTEVARMGGFIVHTFVDDELRVALLNEGRAANVETIDLMGPLLVRLSELLAIKPLAKPGALQVFDEGYLQRIDAINFTVRHDDGHNVHELDKAEIVILGVSRTSKTPLSIYLGYRGWHVANVPIALGVEPPDELFKLPRKRVVGLTIRPERLAELRLARVEKLGTSPRGYADIEYVRQEMAYALELYERRRDWPLIDVTTRPIEETATEIVTLIGKKQID